MWFWWFMLVCDLLIPVIMVIGGWVMWKHCPKSINSLFGYRTTRSMQNMDTWRFAHGYCGRLWWRIGLGMLVPSTLVHLPFYHGSEKNITILSVLLLTLQCIILIASIFPTERALKRNFREDGTRR